MKSLKLLSEKLKLTVVSGSVDKDYEGCYAGDLLSWVMSHATFDNIWLTIMSNLNVVAVASLTEVAAVVLCEGVELDREAYTAALEKDITVLSTPLSVYEMCAEISRNE